MFITSYPKITSLEDLDMVISLLSDQIIEKIEYDIHLTTAFNGAGQTLLHLAAKTDKVEVIASLLKRNVSPTVVCSLGKTALHYACESNSIGSIKMLIGIRPDLLLVKDNTLKQLYPFQAYLEKHRNNKNQFIMILIDQYIEAKEEIKSVYIFSCIKSLNPSMGNWKKEHFINFLGKDSNVEYSDDSDDETNAELSDSDSRLYALGNNRIDLTILNENKGNYKEDSLAERLKTLMSKFGHDAKSLSDSTKGFAEAKDRQAYFPKTETDEKK